MREEVPADAIGFVDTHVHLDTLCDRARVSSYTGLVSKMHGFHARYEGCVGIFSDPGSLSPSFGLWPDHLAQPGVYGAFGCHPLHAAHYDERMEERIRECLLHERAVAWGEIGLDYSHLKFATKEQQRHALVSQIAAAVACRKPIIIHSRDSAKDMQDILKEHMPREWKVQIHCFSDNIEVAKYYLTEFPNAYLGFTGMLTFRSAQRLEEVVRYAPLNRLLLETDGPYLLPEQVGGKQPCHSGFCVYVAEKIAALKEIPVEEVYRQCRENTREMYGI